MKEFQVLLVINIIALIINIIMGLIIYNKKKRIAKGSSDYLTLFYLLPGVGITLIGIIFLFMNWIIFGFDVTSMFPIVIILIGIIYLAIFYSKRKKHKLDN